MRYVLYGVGTVFLLTILYFLFWPLPFDAAGWTPPEFPAAEGVYAENDLLTAVEIIAPDYVGPESIAFDNSGQLYTGLADGRITRMDGDGENVEFFAQAVQPLGMKFDPQGNLIVADATQGLLSIDPAGEITVLVPARDGGDFFYLNDLAVASDGKIYFSQASTKFGKYDFVYETVEHRPSGSLWVYDPETGSVELLIDGMYFANGVALSPDEDFVLVSENTTYRILRYWLTGPQAGESDVFIDNMPGFPDNITSNGRNMFWLAFGGGPASRKTTDGLLPYPFLTEVVMRVPQSLQPAPTLQGYILGLDLDGNVIYTLQDLAGDTYAPTTSVIEYERKLYIGSLSMAGVGRIDIPAEALSTSE